MKKYYILLWLHIVNPNNGFFFSVTVIHESDLITFKNGHEIISNSSEIVLQGIIQFINANVQAVSNQFSFNGNYSCKFI